MTRPAFVQTEFDFEIREINALEIRIVAAEDDADAMLWDQARRVVEQRKWRSQQQIANRSINTRLSPPAPYTQQHVSIVERVYRHSLLVNLNHGFAMRITKSQMRQRFRKTKTLATTNGIHRARSSTPRGTMSWREIDLNPASSPEANAIVGASTFYTLQQNGLAQSWRGRVWMNPPYAQPAIEHFAAKFAEGVGAREITAGVVLVNNATGTDWFSHLSNVATAVCFPTGRVRFWSPEPRVGGAASRTSRALCRRSTRKIP